MSSQPKAKSESLGDRIKNYENINRLYLIPKLHTVIRIDGKAFHTYCKKFKKPFDDVFINAMDETAKYLCNNIQGAKFALVQSDEISIYLSDTESVETKMWFDGNIQKIVSVSAALATSKFNHVMTMHTIKQTIMDVNNYNDDQNTPLTHSVNACIVVDVEKMKLAEFDSRVFQLPNEYEVSNYFLWRQNDASRNSISMVAQSLYSPKELHGISTKQMQELIFQKGINWDTYDPKLKRGRFIEKIMYVNGRDVDTVVEDFGYIMTNQHIGQETTEITPFCNSDKVRTKWKSSECPIFSHRKEFLLSRIN